MTMPASRVARPSTIEEAVRLLADNGPEAVIIAGGTDVVPNLQMKLSRRACWWISSPSARCKASRSPPPARCASAR